jgi:hypothetical protein
MAWHMLYVATDDVSKAISVIRRDYVVKTEKEWDEFITRRDQGRAFTPAQAKQLILSKMYDAGRCLVWTAPTAMRAECDTEGMWILRATDVLHGDLVSWLYDSGEFQVSRDNTLDWHKGDAE